MAKDKLIDYLAQAGFRDNALKTAWAIAKRESGGRPEAFNPNRSTGDLSYGLFQINMLGKMGEARRRQFGLKKNDDLFDPATNAKVAYQMSKGGTDFGPWGIGPNAYRKMPALDFKGFPGAGAAAPSGGGVPAAPAVSQGGQPNNGMQRTMAIIDHFRQKREGGQQGVLPLIGQLMQLNQQQQQMPQAQMPGAAGPAPSGMVTTSQGWRGTHVTDNLDLNKGVKTAGDILASPGTPVGAPEDGVIVRYGSAQGGESMYFKGVSGKTYWLGHINRGQFPPGTRVRANQPIATISADHANPHLHIDATR